MQPSWVFFNKIGTCTKDEFIYLGELEIGMNKKEKYIGLDEQYVEVTLEGCKKLCIGLHYHTCGAVAYHVKVCGYVCRSIGQLTISVLSLLWSIVYVAGKGLLGYIHVQTMLTSPAIPGLLTP